MATLTKDRYRMSHQMNLLSIGSATSLLGSQDGLTLSDSQSGPQIERSGPDHALASPSQQQGNASLTTIPGISGRLGSSSSRSAALTLSLANRLRVVTDSLGSTLFRLTWSQRVTPSGRSIFALRASAHRTSGNGSTSAPWQTPQTHDVTTRGNTGADHHYSPHDLSNQAQLVASWATPRGEDSECAGSHRGTPDGLHSQANLAAWPTASSRDVKGGYQGGRMRDGKLSLDTLDVVAQLTASGPMPNGSHVGTEKRGQLNPAHSRWLQGLPPEWCLAAVTAHRSIQTKRRKAE